MSEAGLTRALIPGGHQRLPAGADQGAAVGGDGRGDASGQLRLLDVELGAEWAILDADTRSKGVAEEAPFGSFRLHAVAEQGDDRAPRDRIYWQPGRRIGGDDVEIQVKVPNGKVTQKVSVSERDVAVIHPCGLEGGGIKDVAALGKVLAGKHDDSDALQHRRLHPKL